jgi:hypothetical protein
MLFRSRIDPASIYSTNCVTEALLYTEYSHDLIFDVALSVVVVLRVTRTITLISKFFTIPLKT